jgi:hypothetical protein
MKRNPGAGGLRRPSLDVPEKGPASEGSLYKGNLGTQTEVCATES